MDKNTILIILFILLVVGFLEIVITKKNRQFLEGLFTFFIGISLFVFLSIGTSIHSEFSNSYNRDITAKVTAAIKNNPRDNNFIQYETKKAMKEYISKFDKATLTNIKVVISDTKVADDKDNFRGDNKESKMKTVKINCDFTWYYVNFPMEEKVVAIEINET